MPSADGARIRFAWLRDACAPALTTRSGLSARGTEEEDEILVAGQICPPCTVRMPWTTIERRNAVEDTSRTASNASTTNSRRKQESS